MEYIYLQSHHIDIGTIATDRHPSITKILSQSYPDIKHEFDLWHIVKGIKKKLVASKIPELSLWARAIPNHLWYCAATCQGDIQILKEKWTSVLHHITNEHHWTSAEKVTKCDHGAYTKEEAKKRPWLKKTSKAFSKLQGIVLDRQLLKYLNQVAIQCNEFFTKNN